ncbi:MAG: 23S rRNA (guanosine(2251)-2'-O)-methyltransferase RlmB [Rhodobacteraceae bacterium]|nr:23S rRNA (guanosine(2251)-2'-O)-methyltransferase RlmB [Paracoccaceae bacterium]
MKKPAWVVEKERARRDDARATLWLFGLHAVRDAILNPRREKLRLVVTRNAAERLGQDVLAAAGIDPEIADPRAFPVPLDPGSVHQGAAVETRALDWGTLEDVVMADGPTRPLVLLLDRVSDPHNVGAILRSAEVFGARAVIAPMRHAAPETGAMAKAASGALERQPYLRVTNLSDTMTRLRGMGFWTVGLSGTADGTLAAAMEACAGRPLALVLGAEGPGMRARTIENCDALARIPAAGSFGSLNVSNAAAIALYGAHLAS